MGESALLLLPLVFCELVLLLCEGVLCSFCRHDKVVKKAICFDATPILSGAHNRASDRGRSTRSDWDVEYIDESAGFRMLRRPTREIGL